MQTTAYNNPVHAHPTAETWSIGTATSARGRKDLVPTS